MNQQDDIKDAFDLLIEYLKECQEEIDRAHLEAIKDKKYPIAQESLNKLSQIEVFRTKIIDLENEWKRLSDGGFVSPRKKLRLNKKKSNRTRIEKGLLTPRENFKIPILRAIVQMGGSGRPKDIVKLVEEMVGADLNEHDRTRDPRTKEQKWQRNVHWARLDLVEEGFISSESPRGIWQITNKGSEQLASIDRTK